MKTYIFTNIYSDYDYAKMAIVKSIERIGKNRGVKIYIDYPRDKAVKMSFLVRSGFSVKESLRKFRILVRDRGVAIFYRPQRLDNLIVIFLTKYFTSVTVKVVVWENYGFKGVKSSQNTLHHKCLILFDSIGISLAMKWAKVILVNNLDYRQFVSPQIGSKISLFPNVLPIADIVREENTYAWGLINVGTQDTNDYYDVLKCLESRNELGCLIGGSEFDSLEAERFRNLSTEDYFNLLSRIDVIVVAFPSTIRNMCRFPNKLLDAIVYGRKVVCSDTEFLRSQFQDYENIFWYSDDFTVVYDKALKADYRLQKQHEFVKSYRSLTENIVLNQLLT